MTGWHLAGGERRDKITKHWDEELHEAVSHVDHATEGERFMILAFEAGIKGHPDEQYEYLSKLVADPPEQLSKSVAVMRDFLEQAQQTAEDASKSAANRAAPMECLPGRIVPGNCCR